VGQHFLRLSGGAAFRKPTVLETSGNFRVETDFPSIKTLLEDIGVSNHDLDNESMTMFELAYQGFMLDRKLRVGLNLYFALLRKSILFAGDVRFKPPPLNMQVDLENSVVGYLNSGAPANFVGETGFVELDLFEEWTFFVRGDAYHTFHEVAGEWRHGRDYFRATAGTTWRTSSGLTANLVFSSVHAFVQVFLDPDSILAGTQIVTVPAHIYGQLSLTYLLRAGPAETRLGLVLFNPFGARFRELPGILSLTGAVVGGEQIGTRVMATARVRY